MKEKAELVLEALIDWIDDDENPVEGLTNEQLGQRTGLSQSDLKMIVKRLHAEGCLILERGSWQTPPDFTAISISASGVKKYAELLAVHEAEKQKELIFKQLLHPSIIKSSYSLFLNGHLQPAVLSAITTVFDLVKRKAGLQDDIPSLAAYVFSVKNPKLILGDLNTETGRNIQLGFANIHSGAHQSIGIH